MSQNSAAHKICCRAPRERSWRRWFSQARGRARRAMRGETRVFSSSLTSRRFPALRTLTAEDVEVMVMPPASSSPARPKPQQQGEKPLFDPNLVKPSAVSSLGNKPAAKAAPKPKAAAAPKPDDRPPFRPCNPKEAREMITEQRHGYVMLHSPYDLAHRVAMLEREAAQKLVLGGTFHPSSWSKARQDVAVNYFLNSPDAETLEAERRYIKDKANRNMVDYYRRMHNNLSNQRDKGDA
jgi:hypothetical protein